MRHTVCCWMYGVQQSRCRAHNRFHFLITFSSSFARNVFKRLYMQPKTNLLKPSTVFYMIVSLQVVVFRKGLTDINQEDDKQVSSCNCNPLNYSLLKKISAKNPPQNKPHHICCQPVRINKQCYSI